MFQHGLSAALFFIARRDMLDIRYTGTLNINSILIVYYKHTQKYKIQYVILLGTYNIQNVY